MRGPSPEASGHTPGPWRLYRRAFNHAYVIESDDVLVARMVGVNDTVTANARLIAAAPDLLAALQDMLATHTARNVCGLERLTQVHQAARAAIAKAKQS